MRDAYCSGMTGSCSSNSRYLDPRLTDVDSFGTENRKDGGSQEVLVLDGKDLDSDLASPLPTSILPMHRVRFGS